MKRNTRQFLEQLALLARQSEKIEEQLRRLTQPADAASLRALKHFRACLEDMAVCSLGEEAPLPWQVDLSTYLPQKSK